MASAGRATVGGTRAAGRAALGGSRAVRRGTKRLTHAQGAGRTGLGGLIELSAAHSAGDALIAVALAGTLFFGLPVDEARGHVALYLLITMAPFAVVAPFVGPVLDRFRSGRRYVMAGTLFARGLLCWSMAAAVPSGDAVTLFPAALGVLVLSKAYNVSRAAIMPVVLPANIGLVAANARVALFTLVAAGVMLPVGAGLTALTGPEWVLRGTMVLFFVAGVHAVRLPRHVDSPDLDLGPESGPREGRPWRTLFNVGPIVGEAMRANAGIRLFSGYLLFYLLFLVQEDRLPGLDPAVTLGALAAAAGAGGLLGAAIASWARGHSPRLTVLGMPAAAAVTGVVAAVLFNVWTAVALALVAALAQELGKLALDAIVQEEIGEEVRSSTFGVVEALLQIAWVLGGLAGLLMSLYSQGPAGLTVVAGTLFVLLGWLLVSRRRTGGEQGTGSGLTTTEVLPHPVPGHGDGQSQTQSHTKPLTNPHG
ncbi:MFS transporter [Microtetraspora sp. NBRC 13810]|nr:MFS transporter [Microtetraspora sp. NBRC 13810]